MALSVGIVGLSNSGKTTLFKALTRTGATVPGKENVGMASIPDERLEPVAAVEHAKKITPASLRVVDVPGTGAELLGNLRQVDALLAVLDAKLEMELAELPEEEAAAFREDGSDAGGEIARRLYEAVDLITFFTAAEN